MRTKTRGFTLIELLVVISIIGLLASVVLVALNSARLKGRDAAIRQQVRQFVNLMTMEYNDNKSYANLANHPITGVGGWIGVVSECATGYSGSYATQARQVCTAIMEKEIDCPINSGKNLCLWTLITNDGTNGQKTATIMAWLPGQKTYVCAGSSGKTSDTSTGAAWNFPGCYSDP